MSLRRKVADAYLAKQGRYHPQPQQPPQDLNALYLSQRQTQQQRARRRTVQPAEKKPIDVLRDAADFLNG